jgi:hypothetical protein
LGDLWNRTEISSQFNLEQADQGTRRRKAIDPQIRRSCQDTATKWLGTRARGALEGVLILLTNQKRIGCDVTVGSQSLEHREFYGSSCLACCYDSPGSKAGST